MKIRSVKQIGTRGFSFGSVFPQPRNQTDCIPFAAPVRINHPLVRPKPRRLRRWHGRFAFPIAGAVFGGCAVGREQIERFDVVNAAAVVAFIAGVALLAGVALIAFHLCPGITLRGFRRLLFKVGVDPDVVKSRSARRGGEVHLSVCAVGVCRVRVACQTVLSGVARRALLAFHLCPLISFRLGGVGAVFIDTRSHVDELSAVGVRRGEVLKRFVGQTVRVCDV